MECCSELFHNFAILAFSFTDATFTFRLLKNQNRMSTIYEISLRLFVALLLGGAIGIEREYRSKDAGFRTHFLVALGSALFCIVSQYGFGFDLKDSSRVAAQVVSGIGFLGAGTIIFQKNMVRGLTTAAGLWVTAAIGLTCGTGMYAVATIATAMVLLGLELLNAAIPQIGTTTVVLRFSASSKASVAMVMERLKNDCIEIYAYDLKDRSNAMGEAYEVRVEMKMRHRKHDRILLGYMNDFKDITITSIE